MNKYLLKYIQGRSGVCEIRPEQKIWGKLKYFSNRVWPDLYQYQDKLFFRRVINGHVYLNGLRYVGKWQQYHRDRETQLG